MKKYKKKDTKDKKFWTVQETAQELSLSPNHIYKQISLGKIKVIDHKILGKRFLIPQSQFDFLNDMGESNV